MNARTQFFELTADGKQIEEIVSSVFHTVLLHRSMGKFRYKAEGNYSVGVIGTEDIDCKYIDLTYVRVSSNELSLRVSKDAFLFAEAMKSSGSNGVIRLEFVHKKKSRWPLNLQHMQIPWEVWQIQVSVADLESEKIGEEVGEMCANSIMKINSAINRAQYIPKMPTQSDLPYVFDTSFSDVQPYLFRVKHELNDGLNRIAPAHGISSTVKALLKDTISL